MNVSDFVLQCLSDRGVTRIYGYPGDGKSKFPLEVTISRRWTYFSLYKDVASAYVQMVTGPAQARQVIDRAFRIAKAEPTVIIPNDVQEEKAEKEPLNNMAVLSLE